MDIEVLKKIRTPVKRAATELSNSIKIEIEKKNASSDLIEEHLAKLIDKEKQLENVDKDITILTNMDDLEKEIEKQQEYRDSIITCKWQFIIERAPWWGGFYERLIRTVKLALRKTVGRATLFCDELETLLIEIEGVLNFRPLTHIFSEFIEPEPLTPTHMIL
ncbi:integrase catalytic domain-containing protein [Trichonephila clavipes]|nr:integrase catalytic domain-containing protein [Trichonephila clavipes]